MHLVRNYLLKRGSYHFFIRNWLLPNDLDRAADAMATMRHVHALQPNLVEIPNARNVTVIAPHPDDEVIGPGGTLLRMIDRGLNVRVIYLTNGSNNPEIAACRQQEALLVGEKHGFEAVFLNFVTPINSYDPLVKQKLAESILGVEVDAIFIPFLLDDHPDHRVANDLFSLVAAEYNMVKTREVWAYQVYSTLPGNMIVDITNFADRKAEAIRMYKSQMTGRDWAHFALGLNAFNIRLATGMTDVRYIETFFVLPMAEYQKLCAHYFSGNRSSV